MAKKKWVPLPDWAPERDRAVEARIAEAAAPFPRPLTARHRAYQDAVLRHAITIAVGPAGTGKTQLACQQAVRLLRAGEVRHVVITRPLVQCDGNLGLLPGDVVARTAPYVAPAVNGLRRALGGEYDRLFTAGAIRVEPLETMRGATFDDSFVLLDEGQLASYNQLKMFLTRLGDRSHFVINGDATQDDRRSGTRCPLYEVVTRLRKHPSIAYVELTWDDVLRPNLVSWIDQELSRAPTWDE